jgi:DNA-binding CsgD family transcriptional regulator
LKKLTEEHHSSLIPGVTAELSTISSVAESEIYEVAISFQKQLLAYCNQGTMPEENTALQERLEKACAYFISKIEIILLKGIKALNLDSDNKAVRTSIQDALDNLLKECVVKVSLLKVCATQFNTISYLQTKANAELDYSSKGKTKAIETNEAPKEILHTSLFLALKNWRNNLAKESNVPVYIVLPQKALLELVNNLPASLAQLEAIKGIGKVKVKRYGSDILEMVNTYCQKHNIERKAGQIRIKEEKIKTDTKKASFDLYKAGRSVAEIAAERQLSPATVEGHLAHYILSGEVSVFDLVSKGNVARIMAYIVENPGLKMSEVKAALADSISYGELQAVMNHLRFVNAEVA